MNPTDPNNMNGPGAPQVPPQPPVTPPQPPVVPQQPPVIDNPITTDPQQIPAAQGPMMDASTQVSQPVAPLPDPSVQPPVAAAPQFQPQPQPAEMPVPPQPFNGVQQPAQTPVQPPVVPGMGAQQPVFGTGPQMAAPAAAFPKKLILMIAAIIGALLIVGGGIWALMTFVFGSIKLETYQGEGYSILVPSDFKKEESSAGAVTFESDRKEGKGGDVYSVMTVGTTDVPAGVSVDSAVKMYDEMFTEEAFTQSVESSGSGDSSEIRDFKVDKTDYDGHTARTYTAVAYQDDTKVGDFSMVIVFGEKKMYMVMVGAHAQTEPGFRKAAGKILNSLKIEE